MTFLIILLLILAVIIFEKNKWSLLAHHFATRMMCEKRLSQFECLLTSKKTLRKNLKLKLHKSQVGFEGVYFVSLELKNRIHPKGTFVLRICNGYTRCFLASRTVFEKNTTLIEDFIGSENKEMLLPALQAVENNSPEFLNLFRNFPRGIMLVQENKLVLIGKIGLSDLITNKKLALIKTFID